MKNLTPELIEKAKTATSAEELLEIAKATGVEMTAAEAATYFAQLNPATGELNDDDLDTVTGGGCGAGVRVGDTVRVTSGQTCPICGTNVGKVQAVGAGSQGAVVCMNCSDSVIAFLGAASVEKI